MESILNFIAEKMWLFLLMGTILPVVSLVVFVAREIVRVSRSKKNRRPEVVERSRRFRRRHKKPLFFRMAHLRKKSE